MPRYFFHLLHPGRAPVQDDEGMQLEDDEAARSEGIASLGDLISDALSSAPVPMNVSVQIVREGYGVMDILTGTIAARFTTVGQN